MIEQIIPSFRHAIMITGFVFVMMLVIEYINVRTKGLWINLVSAKRWQQYLFAAILGAIPGCLGAFTAVALFTHKLISFGALVTAMIATSGDEAFVMLAMFPEKAILITMLLFAIGIAAGYLTDKLKLNPVGDTVNKHELPLHEGPECKCFSKDLLAKQLLKPSRYRIFLLIIIGLLLAGILMGFIAKNAEGWILTTIYTTLLISFLIIITVPDHFIKDHLWQHIAKAHIPKIFGWTFITLLVFNILLSQFDVEGWLSSNMLLVLIVAVLVGIIPQSGPHLVFVTLFAHGSIPLSILLASSISQDGHGMLPLLAESKKDFLTVKGINILYALLIGLLGYILGY
ncbi:MAG: putative manganese transporter [Bacteroidota bacterium]